MKVPGPTATNGAARMCLEVSMSTPTTTEGTGAPQGTAQANAHGLDPAVERLLAPTYQNRLRVIGRHLDLQGFRAASLLEVEGGILARAFHPERHAMELLEFPDDGFRRMMVDAVR